MSADPWQERPALPRDPQADVWLPTEDEPGLVHDEQGDRWQRHASGVRRDREVDRQVREAIVAEQVGEWGPGGYQPSSWEPV